MNALEFIDSHTEGEPTRVILSGGPDLGTGTMAQRRELFRQNYDRFRSAIVNEPRGSEALVGALLVTPVDSTCVTGVIFFNNVGYLDMCGHGTIGVARTLAHMRRIHPGVHRLETPAGIVTTRLADKGEITFTNVPSYRHLQEVELEVPNHGVIRGDVAWGGNWFFLTENRPCPIDIQHLDILIDYTSQLRTGLREAGITGAEGAQIDHIELLSPSPHPNVNSRNFVLCPGGAYDRSPCGTGTSAHLACLAASGRLAEGETWIQESIIGGQFQARYQRHGKRVLPTITGRAFITGQGRLWLDPKDPFQWGLNPRP